MADQDRFETRWRDRQGNRSERNSIMSIPMNFRPAEHEPEEDRNFEPIAPGNYRVDITGVERKTSKSSGNDYLQIEVTVKEHNRKIWDVLSLWSSNEKAVEIANGRLSSLCKAAGIYDLKDAEQLLGKSVVARVKTQPAKGDYPAKSVIAAWLEPQTVTPTGKAPKWVK